MQKESIFTLKNGNLSAYSFSCGYVQTEYYNRADVQMYMEYSHYHVILINIQKCTPYIGVLGIETDEMRERIFWDSFKSLSEARQRFEELKRIAKKHYNK